MAKSFHRSVHVFLLLLAFAGVSTARSTPSSNADEEWLKKSCSVTRYPTECYESVANSTAIDPYHLAIDAINFSIGKADVVSDEIANLRKSLVDPKMSSVLEDCMNNVQSARDEMKDTVGELLKMDRATEQDMAVHHANAQNYMLAVLDDEGKCLTRFLDFEGGSVALQQVDAKVINMVTPLEHYSINALALVNEIRF